MSSRLPVSVVIVSQDRPEYLDNCLQALRNQIYSNFEVVVVADHAPGNFVDQIKFLPFSEKNISKARNIGLSQASGDIVAFCDDDAIADQTWIERLVAPFDDSKIGATTGYTRGRNGISLQWGAMRFDRLGNDIPIVSPSDKPWTVFDADKERPLKLLGTNMAIRKSALVEIGGFDEAFSYYLDETDAKIRLDTVGWKSAVVPNAMVQHLSAPSKHRAKDREILDYVNIAASKAYFCKKHFSGDPEAELARFAAGNSNSEEIEAGFRQSSTLKEGYWDGASTTEIFKKFKTASTLHIVVLCGLFGRSIAEKKAAELLKAEAKVTILQLLPSIRFFQVTFQSGFWIRRGGTYGKSLRSQPIFRFVRRKARVYEEIERIHAQNPVDYVYFNKHGTFCHENPCLLPLKDHKVLAYNEC